MQHAIIWMMTTMMNALSGDTEDYKEEARSLRREGVNVPALLHKIVEVPYFAPLISGGMSIATESVGWIRDSIAQAGSKNVAWESSLRYICECGAWLPKGAYSACRSCNRSSWFSRESGMRPRETHEYEEGCTALGIRLVSFVRNTTGVLPDKWDDRRYNLMTARRRCGYHDNNEPRWEVSGQYAADVAYALERLGKMAEAAVYRAMKPDAQVHRPVVFFHYIHPRDKTTLKVGHVDVALADDLIAAGKAHLEPHGY